MAHEERRATFYPTRATEMNDMRRFDSDAGAPGAPAKRTLQDRLHARIRRIYRYSVRASQPMLSAAALALLTKKLNSAGSKRILFIGSRASLDDLHALSRYSGKYQYFYLKRFNFREILNKYLPVADLKESTYYTDEKFAPGRKQAYAYIRKTLGYLQRFLRFDAVMSTNLGYLEQQELCRAAQDRDIPVVILLREGMVDLQNAEQYFKVYDGKRAVCDLFICYNDLIKASILRQKVPGLTMENMKVSGIPRCDYYVREDEGRTEDQLVVFTFSADVKFKNLLTSDEALDMARSITTSFYHQVLKLAARRKDIRVILKTKPSDYYIDDMTRIASEFYGDAGLPRNLHITGEGSAKDLILQSRWVITVGNSTTFLESLLANRVTGSPDFSEVIDPERWDFVQGDEELVAYIRTESDIDRFLERDEQDPESRKTQRYYETLNRYLYRTDGQASTRVEGYIADMFGERHR